MTVLVILIVAVLATVVFAVSTVMVTHNRIVALDQRCETAFADIDAHLKHRQNLILPLVETVRGYAGHEHEVLLGIAQARANALRAASPEVRLSAEQDLTQNIGALVSLADKFPELKASSHFSDLRRELVDAENRITASRRFYNLTVEEYCATLRQFPGSVIARRLRMSPRQPFDLGIERVLYDEPIAIKF